jgi:hypothetical protein
VSRRRKRKPGTGGGGARNPASLANLKPFKAAGVSAGPGDQRALRHGGYREIAEAELDEKARSIFAALSADAPLRDGDGGLPSHDAVVVRLLADCLCRLDSLSAWLAGRWATDAARPALELEMRLRSQALDLAESMGMTPRSRARLGLDVQRAASFDLAQHMAAEAAAEEAGTTIEGDAADAESC